MEYATFLKYNIIGALIWGVGVTVAGYALGSVIPSADEYLLPIVFVIIMTSFIPVVVEYIKKRKRNI